MCRAVADMILFSPDRHWISCHNLPTNYFTVKVNSLSVANPSMVSRPSRLIVEFVLAGRSMMLISVVPVDFVSEFVRWAPRSNPESVRYG